MRLANSAETNSPPLEGCQPTADGVVSASTTTQNFVSTEFIATIDGVRIHKNFVQNLPFNEKLKSLTKVKRKSSTLSEVLFWMQVHKRKFHKIDFDRQRIIGNYIVDFYVKSLGLVIEIDGSSHDNKEDYDIHRQVYLESLSLRVYRVTDSDIKKRISKVMADIGEFIKNEYGEKTTPSAKS